MITHKIIHGDILASIRTIEVSTSKKFDVIWADPPFFLRLGKPLDRPDRSKQYLGVREDWDKFKDVIEYNQWTLDWMKAVRRLLDKDGTMFVKCMYHNVGVIAQSLHFAGFHILNSIVWEKINGLPNLKGTRLKNDVEFIFWVAFSDKSKYHFRYQEMKRPSRWTDNPLVQEGSVWPMPIVNGSSGERVKDENGSVHSTQTPIALISKCIKMVYKPGMRILDPFAGVLSVAAAAEEFSNITVYSIEQEERYITHGLNRLAGPVTVWHELGDKYTWQIN